MAGPVDVKTDDDVFVAVELCDVGTEISRLRVCEGDNADLLGVCGEGKEGLVWEEVSEIDNLVVCARNALQLREWLDHLSFNVLDAFGAVKNDDVVDVGGEDKWELLEIDRGNNGIALTSCLLWWSELSAG